MTLLTGHDASCHDIARHDEVVYSAEIVQQLIYVLGYYTALYV